jgi:predicted RNA-binding Zn ribbon-like protein
MSKAARSQNRDWEDGFLFIGNQLALDFLNTCPIQNGEPVELLPDFNALLRWFRAAKLLSAREAVNLQQRWGESGHGRRTVEAVAELRETLRKEVIALERGDAVHRSTIDQLNRLMAEHPVRTRLSMTRGAVSKELWFEAEKPDDLFAPLAHAAAMLFTDVNRNQVRKCGVCVLHFRDTSKKGTRRWCSMRLCGNRLKVAAYAARQHKL